MKESREKRILVVNPEQDLEVIKGLASETRVQILSLIQKGPKNVHEISTQLSLPQSTVATNVMTLEKAGLIRTESMKGRKGTQKICHPIYSEMVVKLGGEEEALEKNDMIEVEMPIGLYTKYRVSAPCGLCSSEGIIGYLDVPSYFLDPGRMKAGLIWFEKGYLEYKFPNNGLYKDSTLELLEIGLELSSEVPGTDKNWLSDITMWINDIEIGHWTSPGDYGDHRGKFTPQWWKLEGSQYGLLKNWRVTATGSYIDGMKISDVGLKDLGLMDHHSVSIRVGVKEDSEHVGGLNIFGRGFGNYDQDIVMRMHFNGKSNNTMAHPSKAVVNGEA